MHAYLVALGVVLCSVYAYSASRQYYPGVGYASGPVGEQLQRSSRLRAAPSNQLITSGRYKRRPSQVRPRAARLREYELLEREELIPVSRQRSRPNYRNGRRSSNRRSSVSSGRRYRLARNEATTLPPPIAASEPIATPQQPTSSSSSSSETGPSVPSFNTSPVRAFGSIFPGNPGGLGSVIGGGYAQTNGPGTAFATGFAQSSGSHSFAGGFGAVIHHPRFPKFGPMENRKIDPDFNKDETRSEDDGAHDNDTSNDSGFDDSV